MFKEETYEKILERALSRISDKYDKREGSIAYDALAANCAELAKMYIALGFAADNFFVETMIDENVEKRTAEEGVYRKEATAALILAEMTGEFSLKDGDRFNCGLCNYFYTGKKDEGYYILQCETAGKEGNVAEGSLTPIDAIKGLKSAKVCALYVSGTDEEEIDSLKQRYFDKIQRPSTGGNVYDYENWTRGVSGVGGVKVIPCMNGAGTVGIIVCDSEMGEVKEEGLIKKVKAYLEERRPVGAEVIVESAEKVEINITADVVLDNIDKLNEVADGFKRNVREYFLKIALKSEKVSLAKLQNILFETEGVKDYDGMTINGEEKSLKLKSNQFPALGDVRFRAIGG